MVSLLIGNKINRKKVIGLRLPPIENKMKIYLYLITLMVILTIFLILIAREVEDRVLLRYRRAKYLVG